MQILKCFFALLIISIAFTSCSGVEKKPASTSLLDSEKKGEVANPDKNYDATAIMERAESYYKGKKYLEAIDEYKRFLELHPTHDSAGYAQYKLGLIYFEQFDDDSIDRNHEPLRQAMTAFERLLSLYPGSPYEKDALEMLKVCRRKEGEYQLYIGKFYYKKEAYQAAIARLLNLLEGYPEFPGKPEALYYLALSYKELGDMEKCRESLELLVKNYPDSKYAKKANGLKMR